MLIMLRKHDPRNCFPHPADLSSCQQFGIFHQWLAPLLRRSVAAAVVLLAVATICPRQRTFLLETLHGVWDKGKTVWNGPATGNSHVRTDPNHRNLTLTR